MRARALTQAELGRLADIDTAHLSRLAIGKQDLGPKTRRNLAGALRVGEADLLQPIGTEIPPEPIGDVRLPGFDERLQAILIVLGVERLVDLTRFLATGDYSGLPPALAQRVRQILSL